MSFVVSPNFSANQGLCSGGAVKLALRLELSSTLLEFNVLRSGRGLLEDSRPNRLLGGLDRLLFPFVVQRGGQLVENNAEKAANERSDNEQPNVTLFGGLAERSGADHETNGEGRVEKRGAGEEETAKNGDHVTNKVDEAVHNRGQDGLSSRSKEDQHQEGREKDLEDE